MAWARWPDIQGDRTRGLALVIGLGIAALYYASFASLVVSQLARLGEGGGRPGLGVWGAVSRQAVSVIGQWGLPALALALLGRPRPSRGGLDRDLTAWWGAGLVLLALSLVTPLDVRWVYGLGPVVAVAAASGAAFLAATGRAGRAGAAVLLAAHASLGVWAAAGALWERYR